MKTRTIIRYVLASAISLYFAYNIILYNSMPHWYGLSITLTGIMWVFFFGIAEDAYKHINNPIKYPYYFKKYPVTTVSAVVTCVAFVVAIYQFVSGKVFG